jgi:N,N'-diacetyllegionaminate synthase
MIRLGNKIIGGDQLFFVIEEGVANWGNYQKAINMIDAIADCGADAVEFQVFNAADFVIKSHPSHKVLSEIELSEKEWKGLINHAHQRNLIFIATALCHTMIEMLVSLGCDAFNINATDINNPDVVDMVVKSKRPFFISVPLATESEIDWILERVIRNGAKEYAILHGQHTMFSKEGGIPVSETNLSVINKFKAKYKIPVGFIDHTPKIWMPSLAIAAGASIITKHLALSRDEKGPDWHICLEPDEMKESIKLSKEAWISINTQKKMLADGEELDVLRMRKSIVAERLLNKGHVIQKKDIVFKRPGDGISPNNYEAIIGKKTVRRIYGDEIIYPKDLQ